MYCSEVQPKTQVAKPQLSSNHPLLPMRCLVRLLKMSPLASGFLEMLLNSHFTSSDTEENTHQTSEYFLDCLERKDMRVNGLSYSLLLSTIKQHRLYQVTSFLKVHIIYVLLWEAGEALEQVAQRSCGCPIPGSVPGQAGWEPWSSGRCSCLCRGAGTR